MAGNTEAVLAAGTIVSFDAADDGTFVPITGITSVGAVGDTTESKERTALADTRKVYGVAIKDAPDQSIVGQFLAGDTDQAAFITKAKANDVVKIKVEWTNGVAAEFEFQTLGFTLDEGTAEDWQMFTVTGKRNTDVTWTDPVAV